MFNNFWHWLFPRKEPKAVFKLSLRQQVALTRIKKEKQKQL